MIMTFGVLILSRGLRQTQTCRGAKPVNVIPNHCQGWFYRAPLLFIFIEPLIKYSIQCISDMKKKYQSGDFNIKLGEQFVILSLREKRTVYTFQHCRLFKSKFLHNIADI